MFVDDFKSAKKIRGMAKDLTKGKIYAFSEYDIFEYPVEREERNVWRDYLFKAQTDPAFYQVWSFMQFYFVSFLGYFIMPVGQMFSVNPSALH